MRLFVAVNLPKEIKDYAYNLQRKINTGLAKIKWVYKKNLHFSLKFLGEVEEKRIDKIKKRLSEIKFEPFKIKCSKIGFFPSEKDIKVIWLGIEPKEKFIKLQQKVDEALLDLFPGEQSFEIHLTLGRVKFVKKKKEFLGTIKEIEIEPIEFEIKNFQLMKSELNKSGPEYEIIEEF